MVKNLIGGKMGYYSDVHQQMMEDGELDDFDPTPPIEENNTIKEKYEKTNDNQRVEKQDRLIRF